MVYFFRIIVGVCEIPYFEKFHEDNTGIPSGWYNSTDLEIPSTIWSAEWRKSVALTPIRLAP